MTKQEETVELISALNQGLVNGIITNHEGIKIAVICDIAKSLSIIADSLQEKEVREND